jgi:hypothetical protein
METFDYLPLREKLRMLRQEAQHVASIDYNNETVSLYRLNNLLVEHHVERDSRHLTKVARVGSVDVIKFLPHFNIKSIYTLLKP